MYFGRSYRMAVWGCSTAVFTAFMLLIVFQGLYVPSAPYFIPVDQRLNNAIAMGLIVVFVFPAIVELNNSRWLLGVDENAPRLMMDVTDAVKSGVPLIRALEDTSTRDYGPMSKPLQNAMARFRLTSNLEEAIMGLGDSLVRPVVKRMSTILLEAFKTGGRIIDVLETSVELFTNLAEYREERLSQMRPYIFVVYLGSFIFLVISWAVLVHFLAPLQGAAADPSLGNTGILRCLMDIGYYKAILFWAAILESLFGGLVAGKIGTGRISGGLIHAVILISTTIVFFNAFNV